MWWWVLYSSHPCLLQQQYYYNYFILYSWSVLDLLVVQVQMFVNMLNVVGATLMHLWIWMTSGPVALRPHAHEHHERVQRTRVLYHSQHCLVATHSTFAMYFIVLMLLINFRLVYYWPYLSLPLYRFHFIVNDPHQPSQRAIRVHW